MKNDEKQFLWGHFLPLAKSLLAGIFIFFQLSVSAQIRTITGTVTGKDNQPLTGVTVLVKGTTTGALTDLNGKFTLPITSTANTLMFSFVGMTPKEIMIGSSNVYDVILSENLVGLDEVVVVGYGTQKKISVTGAIVSVAGAALTKSPNSAVTNTLAGRVTGISTVQYSGQPGSSDPSIYVRGIGSLTESASTPLMLVDGVERSFAQMDPNEIETISILKDASATAVYGIRGANGVIIVTTKRGVEGTPKISFTSTAGLQMPTRLVKMADSYTYATMWDKAALGDNPNAALKFSPFAIKSFKDGSQPLIYPNTNWSQYLVKPAAFQTQENINISGGSKLVKYFVSLGYLDQDGLFKTFSTPNSYSFAYKRYNYRANVDLDMTKTTKFSLTMGGRSEMRQQAGSPPSDGIWTNLYWSVPYSGLLYQGKRILIGNTYIPSTESNSKDGLNAISWGTGYQRALTNIMNLDIGVTQKLDFITKGLAWRFKISNNSTIGQTKTRSTSKATFDPRFLCDADPTQIGDSTIVFRKNGADGLLGYSESSSKGRDWYLETAFNYDNDFGDNHITGLLLYNESKSFYPSVFSDIALGYVGLAGRATYNYKYKYLIEMNLGYNGSENFAPDKRFGFFPAASLGWVLTEENFLKNKIPFLDYLKLRVAYGVVGNDKQGSNRFLYMPDSYSLNNGGYSFGTDVSVLQILATEGKIGNKAVTWERARKQDFGIDLRTLKGKLGITADYFYELRNNILTTRNTVPSIFAMTLPALNLGKVENHGYELELKWRDKIGTVNYFLTTNMSFARNKVLYMDEVPKTEPYLYATGLSVNARFGYVFDGFWTQADLDHFSDFPNASYAAKPGDVRYKDLNGDNVINTLDQKPIGFPDYPEYNYSISGGADYKGFDISFLWNGVSNVSRVLNDTWRVAFGPLGDRGLLQWLVDNQWTPETAATAQAPRLTFSGANNNTSKLSALWVRDAAYLRLKNVELGYSFSAGALKRLGISSMRISASGYDLFTISKLKIVDPEQRTSSFDYPLIKIVNLGVNVNF